MTHYWKSEIDKTCISGSADAYIKSVDFYECVKYLSRTMHTLFAYVALKQYVMLAVKNDANWSNKSSTE